MGFKLGRWVEHPKVFNLLHLYAVKYSASRINHIAIKSVVLDPLVSKQIRRR